MNYRKIRSFSDANINNIDSYFGTYNMSPPLQRPRIQSVSGSNSRCVGTNPSDFYAAERLLGFPKIEYRRGTISNEERFETQFLIYSEKKNDTLESLVNFDDANRYAQRNSQNCIAGCDKEKNLNSNLNFENEKGSSTISIGVPNKTRIRWSQELHEKFVESVDLLGGADKATPKGILNLMKTKNLTICHVKSHLQKYRIAKHMPQFSEGKSERPTPTSETEQLKSQTGIQINEALRMQLEVQRSLHEQLEVQRKLQIRIEEQGRKLQQMFEEQMKANNGQMNTQSVSKIS